MDSSAATLSTEAWLLERFGPTMTHREVAQALKLRPETLRRKLWGEGHRLWIQSLRAAQCHLEGRAPLYRTVAVAAVIDGPRACQDCATTASAERTG